MSNAYTNDDLVFLTKLSEKAGKYPEMRAYISSLVMQGYSLDGPDRQLFSVAYRECIKVHRNTWRTLRGTARSKQYTECELYIATLIEGAEAEIRSISHEILDLLSRFLLPTSPNTETRVYYRKMEGDYKRYLAEISSGKDHSKWSEESHEAYKSAADLALSCLKPIDPTRLGLFMNLSVFYYEVYNSPERACILGKAACDEAIDGGLFHEIQNGEGTEAHRESAEIVELIQKNLSKWSARLVASV